MFLKGCLDCKTLFLEICKKQHIAVSSAWKKTNSYLIVILEMTTCIPLSISINVSQTLMVL